MDEKNLWGNLEEIQIVRTPTAIVKEQAQILTAKTKDILRGEVVQQAAATGWFSVRLDIVVPTLNFYTYSVAKVMHPITLYPATIADLISNKNYEVNDEEEFIIILQSILSSDDMKRILTILISQAKTST